MVTANALDLEFGTIAQQDFFGAEDLDFILHGDHWRIVIGNYVISHLFFIDIAIFPTFRKLLMSNYASRFL